MLIRKLSFKNITTLICGNLGAQGITFFVGLILARRYSPEDFGILGTFLALSNILTPISCLGYEPAIVIAKDIKESLTVAFLCFLISVIFSTLILLPITIFKEAIICLFNTDKIYPWLYLLPVAILSGGVFNVLNYFNIKLKEYKNISYSNVIKSFGCAVVQLGCSFIKRISGGLIIGQVLMNFFGNAKLFKPLIVLSKEEKMSLREILVVGNRFKKFPQFYLWGVFSNNISLNVTSLLINKLFNLTEVGYYSYAYKYIGFPISLIASSTGQVYYQEISDAMNKGTSIKKVYNETLVKLLLIGIPLFAILYFIVKPGFIFLLGERWLIAGEIGQFLIPLLFVRFLTSPLSMTFLALEKQKSLLFWQILLSIFSIIPFVIVYYWGGDFMSFIYWSIASMTFCYVMYFITIFVIVRK